MLNPDSVDTMPVVGGNITCSDEIFYRSKCDLTCQEGYIKRDQSEIECVFKNEIMMWDGVMSKCAEILCSESPILENGEYQCESDAYNSACTAKCKNGYRLIGSSTVICGSSGTYELADGAETPICELIKCPTLEKPANGAISLGKGSETVNSTAQI